MVIAQKDFQYLCGLGTHDALNTVRDPAFAAPIPNNIETATTTAPSVIFMRDPPAVPVDSATRSSPYGSPSARLHPQT